MRSLDDDRIPAWRRYLRFWRSNSVGDVEDELSFHLESTVEEMLRAGMSPEAAREAARRKFGDVDGISRALYTLSQQRERRMTRAEWFDALRQDFVYAFRQLRKSPAFTAVAVITLALGIGANSAIFSVVYSVLLRPLPYANADRVFTFAEQNGSGTMCCLPYGNFDVWRREATSFEALGATTGSPPLTLTGQGDPAPIPTTRASAGYWKAMFIPPALGHYFTEADDRDGAPNVVVISYAMWQNRFGGDRSVIGRNIMLNGRPYAIVGVASPQYVLYPPAEKVWVPLAPPASRLTDFKDHELRAYGLLRTGVPLASAIRQLTQIETRLAHENPHSGYDGGVAPTSLVEFVVGPLRLRLYMLLGAVALVLLIACGNIASLLLARANVRRAEMAIRGALGATRGRIVMQLLVESLLLGLGGAVLGLGVAIAGMRFLTSSPANIPRLHDAALNGPVLAFTFVLAVVSSILFGLVPAIRVARLDLQQTLRDGGRESRGAAREKLRRALVVGELCVAQILLIGAGLLIRSSIALQGVPAGFDTRNLLAIDLQLPIARYAEPPQQEATFQAIENAIASVPGVRSVGRTQVAPIHGFGWDWTAFREGSDGHDDGAVDSNMRSATPDYFNALGLRLLRGRSFTRGDAADGPKVAIISRGLAKRLYGEADPIGRRIGNGNGEHPGWREIVGVVDDMRSSGLANDVPRELYMPSTQWVNRSQTFVVRGAVPVLGLVPAVRRAVAGVDPMLALSNVSTIEQSIDDSMATSRFTTWLLGLLGATGLILAAVGVYGVIAYMVAQRTHELGVRMALGATGGTVQWMVVRQGFVLAAVGVAVGILASLVATKTLQTMVFGISPRDPVTFIVVAGVLALVAVIASFVPARRATRIDPLVALRGN